MIKYDTASFSLGLGVEKEKEEDRESDDLLLRFRSAIKKHAESLETSNAVDEERPIERQDLSASHAEAEFIELESFAPATRAMNNIKVNESAEGPPPSGKIVPYWMKQCRAITSPLLRLHQEIVSLVELLQPTAEEANDRMSLVSQVNPLRTSPYYHDHDTHYNIIIDANRYKRLRNPSGLMQQSQSLAHTQLASTSQPLMWT